MWSSAWVACETRQDADLGSPCALNYLHFPGKTADACNRSWLLCFPSSPRLTWEVFWNSEKCPALGVCELWVRIPAL